MLNVWEIPKNRGVRKLANNKRQNTHIDKFLQNCFLGFSKFWVIDSFSSLKLFYSKNC